MKNFKRIIALLLTLTMVISVSGCNKNKDSDSYVVTVNKTNNQKEFENYAGNIIREYISLRMDIASAIENEELFSTKENCEALLDNYILRCDELEKALDAMDIACDEVMKEKATSEISEADDTKLLGNSLIEKVYAEESSDKVKEWAYDIQNAFDSYPQGKQLKGLANYLKTDVQTAKKAFDAAMGVIQNDALEDEQYAQDMIDRFKGIQSVCKVEMLIAGCAVGEVSSTLEAGAFILGGVDTLLCVGTNGCEIFLGEDNVVSVTANKFKDTVGPAASIAGCLTLSSASSYEKISYIGESIVDLFSEGKILGGTLGYDSNKETIKIWNVDAINLKEEELIKKEVESNGAKIKFEEETNTIETLPTYIKEEYKPNINMTEIPSKLEMIKAEEIEETKAEVKLGGDKSFTFELDPSCESWPKSTALDCTIYYAFRQNKISVNKNGDSYSFTIPAYGYDKTEDNSTYYVELDELNFVSSEVTKEKIVFELITPVSSYKKVDVNAGNNSHFQNEEYNIEKGSFTLKCDVSKIKGNTKVSSVAHFEGNMTSKTPSTSFESEFVYGQSWFSNSYVDKK